MNKLLKVLLPFQLYLKLFVDFLSVFEFVSLYILPIHVYFFNSENFLTLISETKNIVLLEEEIANLRQENMKLKIQVQELEGLKEENKRLRKIKIQSERTSKKQLIAKIISDSASPTKNIVAIDKGKNDGVFVGQNVIGIKGLIGQVIETTFVSSKVILINDTSHNVPGEINRSSGR